MPEFPIVDLSHREKTASARRRYRLRIQAQDKLYAAGLMLGWWLGASWALMLSIGIMHDDWWHHVPAMNYTTSLAITFWPFAVGYAAGFIREYLGLSS